MTKYLLDANIIIKLWEKNNNILEQLLKSKQTVILKEVLEELSVKEKKNYRRQEVLSERFCKLLPYSIEINKKDISGFYMIFDYEAKGKFENNNLSESDFMQLYLCYINEELILVTEDKQLKDIAQYILGKERVFILDNLVNEVI